MQNLHINKSFHRPLIVGVGGFSSDVGKTTLVCDLLRAFPGAEAIKATRGHHRSCGKDPKACCVSDLLGESAVVRSGSEQTYTKGKDTGNYWDAGAVNVHWVIATDTQVNEGVQEALARVQSEIVFIEGNSFTQYIDPDFFIMVIRRDRMTIKKTARNAMNRVSAIYVSGTHDAPIEAEFEELSGVNMSSDIPVFSSQTFSMLVERIQNNLHRARQTKPFRAAS